MRVTFYPNWRGKQKIQETRTKNIDTYYLIGKRTKGMKSLPKKLQSKTKIDGKHISGQAQMRNYCLW